MWNVLAFGLLLALLSGFFLYILVGGSQKSSVLSLSAGKLGSASNLISDFIDNRGGNSEKPSGGGTTPAPTSADPSMDLPSSALSAGPTDRPICSAPKMPCVGEVHDGQIQGPQLLIPGSYLGPFYWNTGSFKK